MPTISIDQIKIGSHRRPVKDDKVTELMQSIQASGLLNPITVDQNLNLIAGLHRLTAYKLLKFKEIECHIVNYQDTSQARLAEIDENLIRNELDPLERGQLFLEREQLLDNLGLRAKAGDNQYTLKGGEIISRPPKTNQEFAKEAGYSERSLQHDKQIARDIHPELQQIIKNTPLAKIKTELLKIARTGSEERILAEAAQKAVEKALAQGEEKEAQQQAKLAAEARTKQKELQMLALKNAIAEKESKLGNKKVQSLVEKPKVMLVTNQPRVKVGDEWTLGRHLVYCGDTSAKPFMQLLPGNAALAIATISPEWNHDYLVNEAKIVAVLRKQGHIYGFCSRQQMPFQYELLIGDLYVGIFSHQSISKPRTSINIEGVEGIINYLINLYTNPNNFVIAPFMGDGEILIACQRMNRIGFIGDHNLEVINRGITRWEKETGKHPEQVAS